VAVPPDHVRRLEALVGQPQLLAGHGRAVLGEADRVDAVERAPDQRALPALDPDEGVDRVAHPDVAAAEERAAEVLPGARGMRGCGDADAGVAVAPGALGIGEDVAVVEAVHVRRPQEALRLPAGREGEHVADEPPLDEVAAAEQRQVVLDAVVPAVLGGEQVPVAISVADDGGGRRDPRVRRPPRLLTVQDRPYLTVRLGVTPRARARGRPQPLRTPLRQLPAGFGRAAEVQLMASGPANRTERSFPSVDPFAAYAVSSRRPRSARGSDMRDEP
jgi:hypothetical protein